MILTKKIATSAAALMIALGPIAMLPAAAQDAAPEAAPEAVSPEMTTPDVMTADFTDEQLESFVVVARGLEDLQAEFTAELEAAATPEEQQAVIEEANTAMLDTIEATDGITVEEYIRIGEAAAVDAELNSRIMAMLEADI